MKWWKRLRRGKRPTTGVPSNSSSLHLDLPGWTLVEERDQVTYWRDADGDALSLAADLGFVLTQLSDEDAVRAAARELAESVHSGLVEARIVQGSHGPAVMLICKRLDVPAFVFTGMLFVTWKTESWLWSIVARERGTTGVREALVTTQLINEGKLTVESYESSWAQDPYDPTYRGVEGRTLRYLSDDESYDSQFPGHPLSKVRRELRRLLTVTLEAPDRVEGA